MLRQPSQTRPWSWRKPNCYCWRQHKKIGKNRGILKPNWAFVESNTWSTRTETGSDDPHRCELTCTQTLELYIHSRIVYTFSNCIYILELYMHSWFIFFPFQAHRTWILNFWISYCGGAQKYAMLRKSEVVNCFSLQYFWIIFHHFYNKMLTNNFSMG